MGWGGEGGFLLALVGWGGGRGVEMVGGGCGVVCCVGTCEGYVCEGWGEGLGASGFMGCGGGVEGFLAPSPSSLLPLPPPSTPSSPLPNRARASLSLFLLSISLCVFLSLYLSSFCCTNLPSNVFIEILLLPCFSLSPLSFSLLCCTGHFVTTFISFALRVQILPYNSLLNLKSPL